MTRSYPASPPSRNTAAGSALLLAMMEPPASLEEEFNDWYDTEHFPQRLALPGFHSGRRWVCIHGWPRYLATYQLDAISALEHPDYLAVSGEQGTPWSRRILPRTLGRQRLALKVEHAWSFCGHSASLCLLGWALDADADAVNTIEAGAEALHGVEGITGVQWAIHGATLYQSMTLDHIASAIDIATWARLPALPCTLQNLYLPYRR